MEERLGGHETDIADLPDPQLSILMGKYQILFVYLRDSDGVNTGDG